MDNVTLRLPGGRKVSRQVPKGMADADVQKLFLNDYIKAGYKSAGPVVRGDLPPMRPQLPSFEDQWRAKLGDQGAISAPKATVGSWMEDKFAGALNAMGVGEREAARLGAKTFRAVNDLTPVGNVTGMQDGAAQFRSGVTRGDLGAGALGAGIFALSALPLPGAIKKAGKGAAKGMFGRMLADDGGAIRAWHGSPHDFDRFSLDKIGTGEGAQAYGHGLYFAENKAVADEYRKQLSGGVLKRPDGLLLDPYELGGDQKLAAQFLAKHGDPEAAKREAAQLYAGPQPRRIAKEIDSLIASGHAPAGSGRLYEVNINAEPEDFLDLDAGIRDQSGKVKDALRSIVPDARTGLAPAYRSPDGRMNYYATLGEDGPQIGTLTKGQDDIRSAMQDWTLAGNRPFQSVQGLLPRGKGEAERLLRENGLAGFRYLDQGSRTAADGTRNFVVFDDSLVDIVNKF